MAGLRSRIDELETEVKAAQENLDAIRSSTGEASDAAAICVNALIALHQSMAVSRVAACA